MPHAGQYESRVLMMTNHMTFFHVPFSDLHFEIRLRRLGYSIFLFTLLVSELPGASVCDAVVIVRGYTLVCRFFLQGSWPCCSNHFMFMTVALSLLC